MIATWVVFDLRVGPEHLGLLPDMLDENDPRCARDQLDANYQHGGGWYPMKGFKLDANKLDLGLRYPGDPPMMPMAATKLRDETIVLFECEWVAIIQRDGSFEVCRMD